MPDLSTLVMFSSASVLLALAPGPDNIFVLTQSALKGKLVGLVVTMGLCTGLLVHTSAVVLGAAVIFQTSALAFHALKYIGAGYLLYLAWHAFRAGATRVDSQQTQEISLWRYYVRGIIMNVTNPKVSIFFLAFLPQFTNPDRGSLSLQLIVLGLLFIVATFVVFGAISLLAATLGQLLAKSDRLQILLNRVAGTVFVGLALKLATAER
ncbi:LysE family translocator [Desulfobulbus oligotrophicus]|uniref:LysE family translocator n=1 Tax=Desulfobulbus oligotrophicus TaxID=1909699 RepID=A0A7T5VEV8_9BACT|nr:LysE family translocator [Desulfobulbus oligotrophicus]QQG66497.1 LysE family translocator [Desulfobulbus oligotrophicus]